MWTLLALFLAGLLLGSWLSVITWRCPRGKNFIKGRSVCPKCGRKISWFDNIPLLSFLLLKGRCRNCQQKISLRYPLIEILAALGFVGLGLIEANILLFALFLITFSLLIIDLESQIIPDELIFFGLILVFISFLLGDYKYLFIHLVSGFASAFFLLLIHLATSGRGMGLGDVKLAILGGLILGWPKTLTWLFLAFILGAIAGLILILFKKASFGKPIAFGPFLIVSLWLMIII